MKRVISISLGTARRDYQCSITLLGQSVHIQRIGVDGDWQRVAALLRRYDGTVDAISLEHTPAVVQLGAHHYPHAALLALMAQARVTPVVDGRVLQATLERWAIKRTAERMPGIWRYRHVLLLRALQHYQLAHALSEYQVEFRCADPLISSGLPGLPLPRSLAQLESMAPLLLPLIRPRRLHRLPPVSHAHRQRLQRLFHWADVVVGSFDLICDLAPADLRGRTLITDDPSPAEIDMLRQRGVATLLTMTPIMSQERPFLSTAALEAIITAVLEQGHQPDDAEVLDVMDRARWEPTLQSLQSLHEVRKFAFVIHPLKPDHIYNDTRFSFARYFPQRLVEWLAAFAPPLYLSRIRGIRSLATGQEIEGILLTLGATPREMLRRSPAFTYRRLIRAARLAERMGARIMGLGAFTSVVGDAGITVAQKSEIGITSGNSLTVAATLASAQQAVLLMGGRIDQGCAMVIGATGSIGSVCARLLAQVTGHIVLVAPRPERLLALKQQIEQETPGVQVVAATRPEAYLGTVDLIITTTSALTGKIMNIDRLKPGAVVCDVARPPDVRAEDAARRPDVLVIESGEIVLPGNPDFGFDIGLPPGTAYACLAETALLAMEGRFEDYTLGRDIQIEQVKEIYRLMQKHGLTLARLRSFGQYITDADIAAKRRLANERRQQAALYLTEAHRSNHRNHLSASASLVDRMR